MALFGTAETCLEPFLPCVAEKKKWPTVEGYLFLHSGRLQVVPTGTVPGNEGSRQS